jgi:hypothetical protein
MFNLIMFNVDWTTGHALVPLDRVFEYTADNIRQQFKNSSGAPELEKLAVLPCLFCEEGITADHVAYVGHMNRPQIVGRQVSFEISFDTDVPQLTNDLLHTNRMALSMPEEWEFSRNHWAVKDVDLYHFLLRTIRPRRQRPTVFPLAEHERIEPALVSVMMPFAAEFDAVFEAIKAAAANASLQCRRADDIWENASIIQDVVSLIDRSRIVVCDCTGRNPNVFYEAGIAHTLGREVILIAQNEHDIPFDLRHLRYIRYLNNGEGLAALTAALQARMETVVGH